MGRGLAQAEPCGGASGGQADENLKLQAITMERKTTVALTVLSGLALTAMAQEAAAKHGWKTTAALAAGLSRGNSDTANVALTLNTERKWDKNEFFGGAGMYYGETDDETTTASANGFLQYNRLFTERLYGFLRTDALHDDVADIAYRVTISAGAGYYLVKTDKITLSVEAGPGYVFEQFHNQDDDNYATIRFGEKFAWQITKTARLWQSVDYAPRIDEWSDYQLTAEIGIATKITEALDLRVVASDSYRSEPAADREENDFKLTAGVGYTF